MDRADDRPPTSWPRLPNGDVDAPAAMSELARAFPTLRDAEGITPWDVDRFVRWLCRPASTSGALHAGRFLLALWNETADWREFARELGCEGAAELAPFNLPAAMATWDRDHRAALERWVRTPFFP